MKTKEDALALAGEMVQLGKNAGRKAIAVVSNMDQPLGNTVGNALEVREAIDTLNGKGPADFTELVMTLGSYMLIAGGKADKEETARKMLTQVMEDGSALHKLAEFVKAQGGDESYVYEPEKLPCAKIWKELVAPEDGYIQKIVCDEVGICSLILGGGRETKESQIDLSVGIRLVQKVGAYVHKGDVLAELFANDSQKLEEAMTRLQQAYHIGAEEVKEQNVILDVVK
jgi:pyrimidine-nucleoside phosphorylase